MKTIKFKCWIEDDQEKFYGPGPNELIKHIQKEGSLSKAAAQMNMSYKKSWDLVQRLNLKSREPLVILKKGGQHGGGAEVTPYALKLVEEFDKLQRKMSEITEQQMNLLKVLE
ncbi:winged helix-turn-helix domain-containing protein [Christiangramia sp.]|uniref:winged helix-turn-helix domain-containing protein n=1 Tax=Christiangramia sp. TaxID=1931228 RepID=UPI0026214154|nr:winged helix-turn-helix domain-containing protein [Christiangramia sp.]